MQSLSQGATPLCFCFINVCMYVCMYVCMQQEYAIEDDKIGIPKQKLNKHTSSGVPQNKSQNIILDNVPLGLRQSLKARSTLG